MALGLYMAPYLPLFDPFIWLPWHFEKDFIIDSHYAWPQDK